MAQLYPSEQESATNAELIVAQNQNLSKSVYFKQLRHFCATLSLLIEALTGMRLTFSFGTSH